MTAAMDMLMKFGDIVNAENLFRSMKEKDKVNLTVMMKGNSTAYSPCPWLKLFPRLCTQ